MVEVPVVDVVWMVAECTSVLGLYVRGVGYDGVLHGASEAFFLADFVEGKKRQGKGFPLGSGNRLSSSRF